MRAFLKRIIFCFFPFFFFSFLPNIIYSQKLIINEFSNGPAGAQEYIELLVVDTATTYICSNTTPPCIDIRGWIIDDNSGYHGTGGVASGCNRFSYDPMWQCIPLGTMILIYNNVEPNTSLPSDDLSMADNNCKLVIPINNTQFFETNPTTPGAAACSYPATGWVPGGLWTTIGMANTGDCVRLVNLTGCEVFSLCYAGVNQNTQIYFASGGSGTDNVWYFNGGNPALQVNWSEGCADFLTCGVNDQTPGAPNNAANSNYIAQFNNNCQPITPLQVLSQQNISANCGCNGSATISASGSIPGYSYQWSPAPPTGQGTATVSGLCPGSVYKCVVTSQIGCKDSLTFNISGTNAITASVTGTGTSCFGGGNATANVTFTGGNGGVGYSWSPAPGSGQGSASVGGLSAQTYTVLLSDIAGCTTTATYTPNQPSQISSSVSTTSVSCFGGSNGTASVTTSGGTGGFNYSWNPGGSSLSSIQNLTSGSYVVTITDVNGCVATNTATINQASVMSSVNSTSSVSCNGQSNGSANIVVSGGTPGYSYQWLPSGGNSSAASGLIAGTYSVIVTDNNSCTYTTSITVNEPAPLTGSVVSTNSVSCASGNNGIASVNANGGTPGYNYSWAPNGGNGSVASNLTSGNYTCTISDLNNCATTVTVNINEPTPLTLSVSTQGAPCGTSGGSATVQASGGTPNYNFAWSTGATSTSSLNSLFAGTYTCYVIDANTCLDSIVAIVGSINGPSVLISSSTDPSCFGFSDGQIVSTATGGVSPLSFSWSPSGGNLNSAIGLSAGSYTVTVTDANGCPSFTVASISDPLQLTLSVSTSSVLCSGGSSGSVTAVVSGGQPNYNYQWSSSGNNTSTLNNMSAGSYSLAVNDNNNCVATATFVISEPSPIIASITTTSTSCGNSNGTASVNVTGGVTPYSYVWSNSTLISDSIFNQSSGNFSVTVTDSNNCSVNQLFSISAGPTANLSLVTNSPVNCFGLSDGSLSVSATGTSPFNFNWFPSGGTTSTATNLSAGTYTCVLTDANNCTDSIIASITQPNPLTATINFNDALCNGAASGLATVVANGGTGSLSYLWTPTGGNNSIAMGLSAGNYTCTISDANNCIITSSVTISEPSPISISLSSTQINCLNSNANITSAVSGGTPNYNFTWSPSGSGSNPSVQSPGIYSLLLTDANGCLATQTVNVLSDLLSPGVNAGPDDTLSCVSNSSLLLNGSSNTPGAIFQWLGPNGFTSSTISPTVSTQGVYTLSVTNPQNGCSSVDSVLISQQPGPIAAFGFNPSSGVAPLIVGFTNGSTGAASYLWDFGNGQTSLSLNDSSVYITSGLYYVTLIASNTQGCLDSVTQILVIDEDIFLNVPNVFTPNGDGKNDSFFIDSKGLSTLNVLIFNRWGTMIYEINSLNGVWDGKTSSGDAPDGTYFFVLKAKSDGGRDFEQTGYLLLSR